MRIRFSILLCTSSEEVVNNIFQLNERTLKRIKKQINKLRNKYIIIVAELAIKFLPSHKVVHERVTARELYIKKFMNGLLHASFT